MEWGDLRSKGSGSVASLVARGDGARDEWGATSWGEKGKLEPLGLIICLPRGLGPLTTGEVGV
jgi:hypothetical protein